MAIRVLIVVQRTIGTKVSKISMFFICLLPFATTQALNFSIIPEGLDFALKIHIANLIGVFISRILSTNSQV